MAELTAAARVGRYQLVSPIGAGGMGKVWVALDTAAPALRLVAVKTALSQGEGGSDRDFWAMLSDEASLASRISHPNVCTTFELGFEHGVHFLVMEWSDGASLRDLLDASPGRRIPPELAAYLGAGVAAGLHAAHELADDEGHPLGVVHRDVSPQNLLVSMRGHVRLADFGVAKARGQQHKPTETGEVKGKLSYMAPEQIASKNIDRRVDVFALGSVLYEATLGVRPFHGADAMATMYKILEQALLLPRVVDPSFPEGLEQVLVKALAKDPDARYQTAEELRAALLDYLTSTKRYVADKHLAELLKSALGEKLHDRNRAILVSAQQLRRGETDPAKIKSPPPPPPTKTLTPEGGVERTISNARRRGGLGSRGRLWAGAALFAVFAVLAVRSRLTPKPANDSGVSAGAPSLQQQRLKSESVKAPATALEAPPAAVSGAPAFSGQPEAKSPVPAPAKTGARRPRVTSTAASSSAPAQSSKVGGRKPRPIDTSNPFESP